MNIFKLELGTKVQDIVTGYKGIITARSEYINKCIRYQVENQTKKNDEEAREWWFDENRLKVTSKVVLKMQNEDVKKPRTGGPQSKYVQ